MARPKSNGSYAPLSATYFRDDAILEAGPDAELLFVRILAFLSDASSDGFITERQVRYAVGYGLRNVQKRVTTLQDVGLLEAVDGGFMPRSWHKWNKTAEEIGKNLKRDRDRKATLARSKDARPRTKEAVSEQDGSSTTREGDKINARTDFSEATVLPDTPSNSGDIGPNSVRNGTGIEADSAPQSTTKQSTALQSNTQQGASAPSDRESLFAEAYESWPKKVDRKDAQDKWQRSVKAFGGSEAELVAVVGAHADAYRAHVSKQFTPALAVWLNKARWDNELPQADLSQRAMSNTEHNLAYLASLQDDTPTQFQIEGAA